MVAPGAVAPQGAQRKLSPQDGLNVADSAAAAVAATTGTAVCHESYCCAKDHCKASHLRLYLLVAILYALFAVDLYMSRVAKHGGHQLLSDNSDVLSSAAFNDGRVRDVEIGGRAGIRGVGAHVVGDFGRRDPTFATEDAVEPPQERRSVNAERSHTRNSLGHNDASARKRQPNAVNDASREGKPSLKATLANYHRSRRSANMRRHHQQQQQQYERYNRVLHFTDSATAGASAASEADSLSTSTEAADQMEVSSQRHASIATADYAEAASTSAGGEGNSAKNVNSGDDDDDGDDSDAEDDDLVNFWPIDSNNHKIRMSKRLQRRLCRLTVERCPDLLRRPVRIKNLNDDETDNVGARSAGSCQCSPGPPGPPGLPGLCRGPRGASSGGRNRRFSGGPPGPPGPKGDKGARGPPGLAALDGLPGQPGLDGMPGMPGEDGTPGRDGLPGLAGTPGRPGSNGTDGIPGAPGLPGAAGTPGAQGPVGPKGRRGPPGAEGPPGMPGITSYTINGATPASLNITDVKDIIVPATIVERGDQRVQIEEGSPLQLRCTAHGQPEPQVVWRRLDGRPVSAGRWMLSSVLAPGGSLNFTQTLREEMGTYVCLAANGIAAPDVRKIFIEVLFPPLIKIANWLISVRDGATARLECIVEAFPKASVYWVKGDDEPVIHDDLKFTISEEFEPLPPTASSSSSSGSVSASVPADDSSGSGQTAGYTFKSILTVAFVAERDLSHYKCIARNAKGTATGVFSLTRKKSNVSGTGSSSSSTDGGTVEDVNEAITYSVYGAPPPPRLVVEDVFPLGASCPLCPDCPPGHECTPSNQTRQQHRVLIQQLNNNKATLAPPVTTFLNVINLETVVNKSHWLHLKPRDQECARRRLVSKVGKPVLVRQGGQAEGGWGRDCFRKAFNASRSFVTLDNDPNTLLEFVNGKLAKRHALSYPFRGNSHVVYNNVFYYHQMNTRSLVRYDLENKTSAALDIDDVSFGRSSRLLYSTRRSHVDVMADENGLWAVYASEKSTNTMVLKFDESSMKVERVWNLTLDHRQVGEMFIVCGVLYAVGGVTEAATRVELAFDLYLEQMLAVGVSAPPAPARAGTAVVAGPGVATGSGPVSLTLSNPYRNTTMITYNPAESGLHSWDHGHQLYYPLLFTQHVQQANPMGTPTPSAGFAGPRSPQGPQGLRARRTVDRS